MTAANEKPDCPCCGSGSINRWPNDRLNWPMYEYDCNDCGCGWDESKRRAQTAEAVDERAIAESAWEAGYISAQQDEHYPPAPPLPDHVFEMIMANARSGTVDEAKEREAFEKWCKDNDYATSAPKWAGWLARARGGK